MESFSVFDRVMWVNEDSSPTLVQLFGNEARFTLLRPSDVPVVTDKPGMMLVGFVSLPPLNGHQQVLDKVRLLSAKPSVNPAHIQQFIELACAVNRLHLPSFGNGGRS